MSAAFERAAALLLLVAACGSESEPSIVIAPSPVQLVPGQTLQLDAQDEAGAPVAAAWSSSDPGKVTVSATGLATGVAIGFGRITATADGVEASQLVSIYDGVMMTAAGGMVTSRDGNVTLEVPPGAVEEPTPISFSDVDEQPLDARVVGATPVTIGIGGPLAEAATLSIAYDPTRAPYGLPAGRLRVATVDGDTWRQLAGSQDDPEAAVAQAEIMASAVYGVRMADPTAPCTEPEHRQFDFWLGEWDDLFIGQGPAASTISRDEAGCTIDEDFRPPDARGASVSFYEPGSGLWYETYVDERGGRLILSGTAVDGAMVLRGPGTDRYLRITWSVLEDGRVRQLGEDTSDGGQSWTTSFDGYYTRAE